MRRIGDVARHQDGATAGLLDPARRLARVLVLAQIADQDVGAFTGEGDRDGAADAGIGAGDQRRPALQLAASLVGLLAVIGRRVELSLVFPAVPAAASAAAAVGRPFSGLHHPLRLHQSECFAAKQEPFCRCSLHAFGAVPVSRTKPRRKTHSPAGDFCQEVGSRFRPGAPTRFPMKSRRRSPLIPPDSSAMVCALEKGLAAVWNGGRDPCRVVCCRFLCIISKPHWNGST